MRRSNRVVPAFVLLGLLQGALLWISPAADAVQLRAPVAQQADPTSSPAAVAQMADRWRVTEAVAAARLSQEPVAQKLTDRIVDRWPDGA